MNTFIGVVVLIMLGIGWVGYRVVKGNIPVVAQDNDWFFASWDDDAL